MLDRRCYLVMEQNGIWMDTSINEDSYTIANLRNHFPVSLSTIPLAKRYPGSEIILQDGEAITFRKSIGPIYVRRE